MPGVVSWSQLVNPSYVAILPHLIVTATLLVVIVLDAYFKEKRSLVWVTLGGVVLAMLSIWYTASDPQIQAGIAAGRPPEFWGGMIIADGFTFFMNGVLLGIAALVILLSADYVGKFLRGAHMEFYEIILAVTLGMMFMVSSRDLLTIYIGLELTSISSYVLAGILRKDAKSNEAALKYFLTGATASAVLLFGLSLIYGVTGSTRLPEVAAALAGGSHVVAAAGPALTPLLVAGMAFLMVGFGFKVAAVPVHQWAPDVYEGAPTPVTAFFSAGPKGAAMAAILRVFVGGLGVAPFTDKWALIWALAAAASMTVGNLVALQQSNIKRMMAYSSIAQAGYILVGVAASGLQSVEGISSVLFYVMAYAVTNLGIFAVLTHMDQEGGWVEVDNYAGLAKRNPLYAWALLLFFVSLIGIPPTVGFLGKFFLFRAAAASGYLWLAVLMAVNSVISVGYYYRVVKVMFLDQSDYPALTPSTGISATVLLSLLGVVALTIFANPFVQWTAQSAALLH
ncbi:NADH-quinone oxidoreductase subunit N [Symbiobacterium thermophilum]|uniref:NADH-quinone oxidoreductase subunit N n=1 Tax=Symbiobacterium thermophilum TaxID=2734 RepID=A0A953I7S2_SYMTR|nr:NADH-quinone oxidoreductase subunit N [Symbiobacterium thermophilum]MBY6275898.1 NADH-quinone oxidoreductase subunit L [Symbiobacterium thermophilum]